MIFFSLVSPTSAEKQWIYVDLKFYSMHFWIEEQEKKMCQCRTASLQNCTVRQLFAQIIRHVYRFFYYYFILCFVHALSARTTLITQRRTISASPIYYISKLISYLHDMNVFDSQFNWNSICIQNESQLRSRMHRIIIIVLLLHSIEPTRRYQ